MESSKCEGKFASFYARDNSVGYLALFCPSIERGPGEVEGLAIIELLLLLAS